MKDMNYQITPDFVKLIGHKRLDSLNKHPTTVYGLDNELNLSYLNPAWFSFAEENSNNIFNLSHWSLGRQVLDAIPVVLKPFYQELFKSILTESKPSLVSKQLDYECSSPDLFRHFSMHLYSVKNKGIIVVHSLITEEPYHSSFVAKDINEDDSQYVDDNKIITQCANCRRIHNLQYKRWDWIPKWIEHPPQTVSHGICSTCKQHYYLSKR